MVEPIVENARTVTINARAMVSELWQRCRGDIPQFAKDFLGVDLHDGQVAWCNTMPIAAERMLSTGNRWGKSTIAAVKLAHNGLFQTRSAKYASMRDHYIAINLSMTIDMAKVAWNRMFSLCMSSPIYRYFVIEDECTKYPFPKMVIGSKKRSDKWRSEVWARSSAKDAQYLLSQDFDFVNWDEAAREPRGLAILDDVLRMRLVDRDGRLDMTSTGDGRNWFYEMFIRYQSDKSENYYAQTGSSYENPNISHDRLKDNEQRMGRQWVQQNIYGGFMGHTSIFDRMQIQACYSGNDWHIVEEVKDIKFDSTKIYYGGIDFGRKGDSTVLLVGEWEPFKPQSAKHGKLVFAREFETGIRWEAIYDAIQAIGMAYGNCPFMVDATGMAGDILVSTLKTRGLQIVPFPVNEKSKESLIYNAQQYVQEVRVKFPYIPQLYDQLCAYDWEDAHLTTDWVFAFAFLCENHRVATEREGFPAYNIVLRDPIIFRRNMSGTGSILVNAMETNPLPHVITLSKD